MRTRHRENSMNQSKQRKLEMAELACGLKLRNLLIFSSFNVFIWSFKCLNE